MISYSRNIDPTIFRWVLRCFFRTPFASFCKIKEFLQIIETLVKAGRDYTLLLKAGIITGQFYDYRLYKREKAMDFRTRKDESATQLVIEGLLKQIRNKNADVWSSGNFLFVPVNLRWVDDLIAAFLCLRRHETDLKQYKILWSHLTADKKNLASEISPERIGEDVGADIDLQYFRLSIAKKIARYEAAKFKDILDAVDSKYVIDDDFDNLYCSARISIVKKKNNIQTVKVKPYDPYERPITTSVVGQQILVINENNEETENIRFISIYQNHIFKGCPAIKPIVQQLEEYFCKTHGGRSPNNNELQALRQRYYRCIRSAYPPQTWIENISDDADDKFKMHQLAPVRHERENIFRLGYGKNNKRKEARLLYVPKKDEYFLLPPSILASGISNLEAFAISDFIETNEKKSTISKLADGGYRVIKKVKVHSPSLAACLVCGYKRNGLSCWKNDDGQTLRKYLESTGHSPVRNVNSKSSSAQPED